jgi:hypothetical protein
MCADVEAQARLYTKLRRCHELPLKCAAAAGWKSWENQADGGGGGDVAGGPVGGGVGVAQPIGAETGARGLL